MDNLRFTPQEAKIEAMYDAVKAERPVLTSVLSEQGGKGLGEYASTFSEGDSTPTIHPLEEAVEAVVDETRRLYGTEMAIKAAGQLAETPVVNSPYHMGGDFFPITAQSSVLAQFGKKPEGVLVALAGGALPANNLTYPLGIQLARERHQDTGTGEMKSVPVKINILPVRKYGDAPVAALPPMTSEMIQQTDGKLTGLFGQGVISKQEMTVIREILNDVYMRYDVLGQDSFSDQASLINSDLWKRLFTPDVAEHMPEMSFLQIEKVATDLLKQDLENPDSLIFNTLFNPELRDATYRSLDGVPGCWNSQNARQGTEFFWGKRTNLEVESLHLEERSGGLVLAGKDSVLPFEPEAIAQALNNEDIYPNLFVTFTELALARGLVCYGGFMQTDYLTRMKDGLSQALDEAGNSKWAQMVRAQRTENYSAGMIPIVSRNNADRAVRPAGAIEIIAGGAINQKRLDQIRDTTVKEASLIGLPGIYATVFSGRKDETFAEVTPQFIYDNARPNLVELQLQ